MTAPPPSSPVEVLEPWIAARLRPIAEGAPALSVEPGRHRPAAVLAPLVERPSGLSVLLTRRADTLTVHSGQIAFPGGRAEPGETPAETALREAEEEIGLDRGFVRLVGLGDVFETRTGFAITPVVGFVRPGFELKLCDAEVAEVFETPFAFLMNPANHERRFLDAPDGQRRHFYAMPYEERLIWGVTAGILRTLYERLFGAQAVAGVSAA